MRILIDENLPRYIKSMLQAHDAVTVQELGWSGIRNGALIARAEIAYDVFLTADKNLRYQQNMNERKLMLIVFPSNKLTAVKLLASQLQVALMTVKQGRFIELEMPD